MSKELYIVTCLDTDALDVRSRVLATRQVFDDRSAALKYALTIAVDRWPEVVSGDFAHLRSAEGSESRLPIEDVADALYPHGDLQREWDAETLEDVAACIRQHDYDLRAFAREVNHYLARLGVPDGVIHVGRRGELCVELRYKDEVVGVSDHTGHLSASEVFDTLVVLVNPTTADGVWNALKAVLS